ncbi:synaptogyrin-2 [Gastrophryne carolinensis]
MESGAYGAAGAGSRFNPEQFLRRPETVLRLLSALFALIVFACILTDGYTSVDPTTQKIACIFNGNDDACHYGVGIGVLAFLASLAFLALDAYLPSLSNAQSRKYIVMADLGFSGLWSFLWFVGFCFLANQWSNTTLIILTGADSARAAIAFSFFSVFSWFPLAALAYKRYQMGVEDFNTSYMDPNLDSGAPYSSYPDAVADNYQRPPFTQTAEPDDGYKPPSY